MLGRYHKLSYGKLAYEICKTPTCNIWYMPVFFVFSKNTIVTPYSQKLFVEKPL